MNNKKWIYSFGAFILLIVSFIFFGNTFIHRVGAFGCFDDCFNIMGGYFIHQGNVLYQDIFFNHMPLGAYVSLVIQMIGNPKTFYELILYHRLFIILFAFIWNMYFIFRFGWWWVGFGFLFEGTKFYIFGDRFLAENMVVYPLVYMFLLWCRMMQKAHIFRYEYFLVPILTWFIVFLREPFVLISLVFFTLLFFRKKSTIHFFLPICIFFLCTLLLFFYFPVKDFVFNVITVNKQIEIGASHFTIQTILQMFLYPLFVFIGNTWNEFRITLTGLSVLFLGLTAIVLLQGKQWKFIVGMLILLGITNIRVVPVGTMFFDAFHMIPWYGLFIASIMVMIEYCFSHKNVRNGGFVAAFFFGIMSLYVFVSPKSFMYEKVNTMEEFTAGYARYFVNGEVIRLLSKPTDTFYVEMWDDPIYWQVKLRSPYQYSWYTSIMPFFPVYVEAREKMWKESPPDFYYGNCRPNESYSALLPETMKDQYIQLYFSDKPSCVYVKKTKIPFIEELQRKEIKKYGYEFNDDNSQ